MKINFLCFLFIFILITNNVNGKNFYQKVNHLFLEDAISSITPLKYSDNHVFCLSATKTAITKFVRIDDNQYQIKWLIKLCNECPSWNIYNITLTDSLQLKNLIPSPLSSFLSLISNYTLVLTPFSTLASTNFLITDPTLWNLVASSSCPLGYDYCINTTSSMIDPTVSFLPAYNTTGGCDCQCSQDSCADFHLTFTVTINNPSCLNISGDISNCVYTEGRAQDTINPYGPPKKVLGKRKEKNVKNSGENERIEKTIQELPKVCSYGCTEDTTHFSLIPSTTPIVLTPTLLCSPIDPVCNDTCSLSPGCGTTQYTCKWILENPSSYPLFQFNITIPFLVDSLLLPSQCSIVSIDSVAQTTLLNCDVLGFPTTGLPFVISGSVCLNSSKTECLEYSFFSPCLSTDPLAPSSCIPQLPNAISTSSCRSITISNTTFSLVVPKNSFHFITKTSSVSTIVCSQKNTTVSFEIDITPFPCYSTPIGQAFTLIDTYTKGLSISNLLVTGANNICFDDPVTGTITCTLIYSSSPIKITYDALVDCTVCNTINNCPPSSITNSIVLDNYAFLPCGNNDFPVSLTLPLQCSCTDCDCTATIKPFSATEGAYLYARSSTSSNKAFAENLIDCKLINVDNGNYTGFYTWSGGQWIGYPIAIEITPTNRHAVQIPINGTYRIECCAWQQGGFYTTPPSRITTGLLIDFINDEETSPPVTQSGTFTCTNTIAPIENPAYIPSFKRIV